MYENETKNFISIHIPTCAEPSTLVIKTIQSIVSQNYKKYEIIVLDNNHQNETLWKPVEKYCSEFGEQVKFVHLDSIDGYKAGALNMCRGMTHKNANYILTVDADYKLEPNALQTINEQLNKFPKKSLLQFPQAYRNASSDSVAQEFAHYFDTVLGNSLNKNNSLGTGTLSAIKIESLDDINGWESKTITEDAELGVRFHQKNHETLFINKKVGKGLLPDSMKELLKQRERWVFGNAQVLVCLLKGKYNSFRISHFSQLTNWLNFLAIPIFVHLFAFISQSLGYKVPATVWSLVYVNYYLFLVSKLLIFCKQTKSLSDGFKTLLVHLNYLEMSAISWLPILVGVKKPFRRTSKVRQESKLNDFPKQFLMLLTATFLLSFTLPNVLIFLNIVLFALMFVSKVHLYFALNNSIISNSSKQLITEKTIAK